MRIIIGNKKKAAAKKRQKELIDVIHNETQDFLKREDLIKQLEEINRDKDRKRLWDSLSTRQKIKVLRYQIAKKGKEGKGDERK